MHAEDPPWFLVGTLIPTLLQGPLVLRTVELDLYSIDGESSCAQNCRDVMEQNDFLTDMGKWGKKIKNTAQ